MSKELERIEHSAQMIAFRMLSEVERLCEEKNINRTELAKMLGTSKSYITQLFRGHKLLNLTMAAKLELVFNIKFGITAQPVTYYPPSKNFGNE